MSVVAQIARAHHGAQRLWTSISLRIAVRRAALERGVQQQYENAIGAAIHDPRARTAFASRGPLPAQWGTGISERIVEFPWVVAALGDSAGLTLDAGSTLNHGHVLDAVLPAVSALHVVTLAPEQRSFPERGVSYVYADLRDLPLRAALYDTVVCLSTLEHVGMDVSAYNAGAPKEADPQRAALAAARELRRVVKPRGRILISVPYGRADDLGWLRQFDEPALRELIAGFGPAEVVIDVYRHDGDGWQLSSLRDAAGCRSQPYWASAVACVQLRPR